MSPFFINTLLNTIQEHCIPWLKLWSLLQHNVFFLKIFNDHTIPLTLLYVGKPQFTLQWYVFSHLHIMVFQGHAGSPILINNNCMVLCFYSNLRLNKLNIAVISIETPPTGKNRRSCYTGKGNGPFLIKDSFSHLLRFYLEKRHFSWLESFLHMTSHCLSFGN